jgi:hypothetical protein
MRLKIGPAQRCDSSMLRRRGQAACENAGGGHRRQVQAPAWGGRCSQGGIGLPGAVVRHWRWPVRGDLGASACATRPWSLAGWQVRVNIGGGRCTGRL